LFLIVVPVIVNKGKLGLKDVGFNDVVKATFAPVRE
jgi:hypothetical protein